MKKLTLNLCQTTMKYSLLPAAAAILAGALSASASPGAPEANGLVPQIATLYINGTNNINNTNTESIGVGIAGSGNVLVAWQDETDNESYTWANFTRTLSATWTMFDSQGNSITPKTQIYSEYFTDAEGVLMAFTNNYLGFFRTYLGPSSNAIMPAATLGPKVHANLFGAGIGMGAAADVMTYENVTFLDYQGKGGFPAVQLLDGAGEPQIVLAGVSLAYASIGAGGDIRIGDWEYLGNSNIVIVGESRRDGNLTNLFGGTIAGHHAIYRIVTPAGAEVRTNASLCTNCPGALVYGSALVSATNVPNSMWHGVAVAKDGFAVRFSDDIAGTCVRMFDNDGNPTTANLVLASLTGYLQAGGGGRGDGAGFHGNGRDAYVHAAEYNIGGTNGFWVTVLNTNGTVRWSRDVSDDLTLVSVGRGDAAITESGEVVVVFNAVPTAVTTNSVVLGRRFDAAGNPVGGTFYVSEKEMPNPATPPSVNPRVAYRNDKVAIVWESRSYPYLPGVDVVAQRYFLLPPSLSVARSGTTVTISWLPSLTGYTLESSSSVAPGSTWTPVPGVVNNSLTTNTPAGTVFYRMKKY